MENGPVQAYAKLEGDNFCYYIKTLQVILGRKASGSDQVDIHLGSTKAISRQHARLYYNFQEQRFELEIFGKNGAYINEQFCEKGFKVPLENRTKIQIGEVAFSFLLPKTDNEDGTTENDTYHTSSTIYQEATNKESLVEYGQSYSKGYITTASQGYSHSYTNTNNKVNLLDSGIGSSNSSQSGSSTSSSSTQGDISEQHSPIIGEKIDTSKYQSRQIKPPFSYASLIAQAIQSAPSKRMTLNAIYNWITAQYPYYKIAQNGWQNSIRHNLSLNSAFVKVPRNDHEPGKGAWWTIDPKCESQFTDGVYKKNRRPISKEKRGSVSPYPTEKAVRKRLINDNDNDGKDLKKPSIHQVPINNNNNIHPNNNNCAVESIITAAANIGGQDVTPKTNGSSPSSSSSSSSSSPPSLGINPYLKRNIAPAPSLPVSIAPFISRQSSSKHHHQFTTSNCWNLHHLPPIAPKKSLPDQGLGNYAK